MFRAIWIKSLRDYRIPILSWGVMLAFLILATIASALPSLTDSIGSLVNTFPYLGDTYNITSPMGYAYWKVMEVFIPLIFCIWPILAGARMVRGDEERSSLDVVLATPHSRARVMLEKLLALVIALLIIALFVTLGVVGGEKANTYATVDAPDALLTALNLSLQGFFFGSVALFISQFTYNRGVAAGWAGGLLVLSYVFFATGYSVTSASWLKFLSPLYYFNLSRSIIPSYPNNPWGAVLLSGLSLVLVVSSLLLFVYRDSGRPAIVRQGKQKNGNHVIDRSLKQAHDDFSLRNVVQRSLTSQSGAASWWLLGILFWCVWAVSLIPSVQSALQKLLNSAPPAFKSLFDAHGMNSTMGFLGYITFVYVVPLIIAFALTQALRWASDLENGRLELLLSTPTPRGTMLFQRWLSVFLLILLAPLLAWPAIALMAMAVNLNVDQYKIFESCLEILPPALVIVGLIYALAGRVRYGVVLGLATGYIVVAFFADFLNGLLKWPDWVMNLSIFHLYGTPYVNGLNWTNFIVMSAIALVLLGIGLFQFRTADLERG